ncbi:MAG: hypothetical protein MHPSP_004197, partial [Paramarteilia canceri]
MVEACPHMAPSRQEEPPEATANLNPVESIVKSYLLDELGVQRCSNEALSILSKVIK